MSRVGQSLQHANEGESRHERPAAAAARLAKSFSNQIPQETVCHLNARSNRGPTVNLYPLPPNQLSLKNNSNNQSFSPFNSLSSSDPSGPDSLCNGLDFCRCRSLP